MNTNDEENFDSDKSEKFKKKGFINVKNFLNKENLGNKFWSEISNDK